MNLTDVIPRLRKELLDIEAALLSLERLQRRSRRRGMPQLLVGIMKSLPGPDEMSARARRLARRPSPRKQIRIAAGLRISHPK